MYKKSTVKRQLAGKTGDALSALIVRVTRLNGLLVAAGDIIAAVENQTNARWQVLAAIERSPATVAEIARVLGLARQSVQRVADVLEADQLVEYRDNPEHRRAKLLRLTAEGRARLQGIQNLQELWAYAVGSEVGEEALRRATQTLGRVMHAVEAYEWEG